MNVTLQTLHDLRQQRRDAHIQPDNVIQEQLFSALNAKGMSDEQIKQSLNEAFLAGHIKVHRTLNGRSIELID